MNTEKMSNGAKTPALNKGAVMCSNFVDELQNDYGASDYDMMMIFETDARTQAEYLRYNPQFQGIVGQWSAMLQVDCEVAFNYCT